MDAPAVGLVGLLVTGTLVGLVVHATADVLGVLTSTTPDLTGVLVATGLDVLEEGVTSGDAYRLVTMVLIGGETGLFNLASLLNTSAES